MLFNSTTFQVFHVLYEPCDITTTTLHVPALPWQLSLVTFASTTHTCFSKKVIIYFPKFNNYSVACRCCNHNETFVIIVKRGKGAQEPKAQTDRAYPGFTSMKQALKYCYSPLDRMLVFFDLSQGYPLSSMSPVPMTKTKWSKVLV